MSTLNLKRPLARPGQVGGKRDENRQKRRQELLDAALPLFLAQGIEGSTIDDIVREAKVAKGSFYRYFADKKALVEALLAPLREATLAAFAGCEAALQGAASGEALGAAYQTLAMALAGVIFAHKDVVLLYLQECRAPAVGARAPVCALAAELGELSLRLTAAAHSHGLLRPLDPRVTSYAVLGAVERLLFETLAGRDLPDPEVASQALITMVLDGLRPGAAR